MVTASPVLAAAVVGLVLIAVVAVWLSGLRLRLAMVTAAGRATVQLAAVSAVLVIVLGSMAWTFVYVTGMVVVATFTAARRLDVPMRRPWTVVPLLVGTLPVVALVLASGTVPWKPQSILPIGGIVVGGAMSATTLAGRRMFDELKGRAGEYEAALAVGCLPRDAALMIARDSAGLALVPALDQTRTVGLVTLPGAFVGVLLGGGTALEAGAAQLLVLVGLLAAEALAVLATVQLVGRRRLITPELAARLPV